MKLRIYLFSVFVFLYFSVCNGQSKDVKVNLDHIIIRGTSNLTDFRFIYQNEDEGDQNTKVEFHRNNDSCEFIVPILGLKNSNVKLLNDFREMVLANQYPFIKVSLPFSDLNSIESGNDSLILNAVVTLAGHSKRCIIPYKKGGIPGSQQFLMGKSYLLLTDFNIEPPVKFMGLIRVDNEVLINFRINFES